MALSPPRLWVALSPHGFGHAAMTAPVVHALRRLVPDLAVTVNTALPADFLRDRFGDDVTLVEGIADFGFRMRSSTEIDLAASAEGYRRLAAGWEGVVAAEADRLAAARPDLVLANIPPVTLAAAARAGVPAVALSSLNWADMVAHYLGDQPEGRAVAGLFAGAYNGAEAFLKVTPAMAMPSIANIIPIGPVARPGRPRREDLARALAVGAGDRVGLIAFGGIDHPLDFDRWPAVAGWRWLSTVAVPPGRDDLRDWRDAGLAFSDLLASVALIVTKPGYATFVEAAIAGIPLLYQPRPDWPECPGLETWLSAHTAAAPIDLDRLDDLPVRIAAVLAQTARPPASTSGNDEAARFLARRLMAAVSGNRH